MNMEQMMMTLRAQAQRANGTVWGAGIGAVYSFFEHQNVVNGKSRRKQAEIDQAIGNLASDVEALKRRRSPVDLPTIVDLLAGLNSGRSGGSRLLLSAERVKGFSFPPKLTSYADQCGPDGNPVKSVNEYGQEVYVGQLLTYPEVAAALAGLSLNKEVSPTELVAIYGYFQRQILLAAASEGAGNTTVGLWEPTKSPALADPALDEVWPVTGYSSSSLEASPLYTTAQLGALVLGAQATAIAFKYGYNQEPQTARSFRVKVTPSTTAGALFTAYLPKALLGSGAPKVHLQVEGIGVVAGGSPYVSAVGGGATPYFTVTTGTNPAATTAYNIVCMVTR